MSLPSPEVAEHLLQEAGAMNPGPWVQHSRNVALAARLIAERHPELDPQRAHTLGLLHDIGRRGGPNGARHVLDGHDFLLGQGYPAAARIALTHSFAVQHIDALLGHWDGTPQERARLAGLLDTVTYAEEDRPAATVRHPGRPRRLLHRAGATSGGRPALGHDSPHP